MQVDMKKLRPMRDWVLIQEDPPEETTKGGLIVPEVAQKDVTRGVVVAVGPGRLLDSGEVVEPEVRAGERVLYGKYSGNAFPDAERNSYRLCRLDDVFGVLEDDG